MRKKRLDGQFGPGRAGLMSVRQRGFARRRIGRSPPPVKASADFAGGPQGLPMILIAHETLSRAAGLASALSRRAAAPAETRNAMVEGRPAPARPAAGLRSRATPFGAPRLPTKRAAGRAEAWTRMRTAANGVRLLRQSVVGFGAALIVSFWIAAFTLAAQDRAALAFQMQRDAGNLALVFAQNVAHTVADLDRGIEFLRWARAHSPASVAWADIVAQDFVSNRETAQTSVIGADGFMVTSSAMLRPSAPMYLGDREHFLAHVKSREDFLFISKPVIGRASGRWSVQFSRRLVDGAGQFAGVVVI